jgi:hypothetical protein
MSGQLTTWTEEDTDMAAIDAALRMHIENGHIELCGRDRFGNPIYRLTKTGQEAVKHLGALISNPTQKA